MISIKQEIQDVMDGKLDPMDNPLKNAPHTASHTTSDEWDHGYSRQQAAYPAPWLKEHKYWPSVGRVDNAFGDRNLICRCPPIEDYKS
jgi:glycine dehydrogenase